MGFFSKSAEKNSDNDSGNDKWKTKYLNLLDTQDLAEKAYKEDQELLCKTIVRLSIVASGFEPQLDPHLQRIRNHLKNGIDSHKLKAELEHFTDALARINDKPAADHPPLATDTGATPHSDEDISLLFGFLLQRYTSPTQQQALTQLQDNCLPLNNPQQLFAAIIEIIADTDSSNGLGVETHTQPTLAQHLIDSHFVNTQLLYLLEHIEIPETLTDKAQTLKQQLSSDAPTPSLETILDSVITLLIEISANNPPKQQEVDKFLVHITEQLTELGLAVTGSSIAVMDASRNRSKLDESVTEQMSDLHDRSMHATQLEPLKAVISSRIAQITQEIQEHKQKEAVQREKSQRQLDELSQKIKAMESETGELKSKLITANTHALRDALTDLPNRLAYDERLKIEIARWQRYHTPLCLIVWDIDHFKKINDEFGHQAGDKVLIHIARQFSEHARRSDFIARFGGEEFTMLLPHTNKQSAFKLAHHLRHSIEQSHVYANDHALSVTISCGITQFIKGDTHDTAFARADQALYRAKEQGRNQCCLG
ncbi:MAG: diguanylate cyclase [Methylovulum sp.]|nr:diguanylate cyclase [Methylovulum sp.]